MAKEAVREKQSQQGDLQMSLIWLQAAVRQEQIVLESQKLEAKYVGFNEKQKKFVSEFIEEMGYPTQLLDTVAYEPNKKGFEDLLGTWEPFKGKMTLYKSLEKLPMVAQVRTIIHEGRHMVSPRDARNDESYGGRHNRLTALARQDIMASQAKRAGVFLNGYHEMLFNELQKGTIDEARYAEETDAIAAELLFGNPQQLADKSRQIQEQLERSGITIRESFFDLAVANNLAVMRQFDGDANKMMAHFQELREKYEAKDSLDFSNNQRWAKTQGNASGFAIYSN